MRAPALAGALALLPWLGVLGHGFVNWDDPSMVHANPVLALPWGGAVAAAFGSFHMTSWQPLGWLLYKALLAAGGGSPFPFHAAALALHGFNAALLYAALDALLPKVRPEARLAAVLAWAWHPVHAESVAWVSQLSDLLCGSFVLASLLALARGRVAASYGSAAAAALCRWKALAAPVFAAALDLHRGVRGRELLRRHAPFLLVAAVVVAVNARAKASVGYAAALRPHEAAVGLLLQTRKLLWPVGLAPADLLDGADNPWGLGPLAALALFALVAAAVAAAARRRPAAGWAAGAFIVLLAPTVLFATPGPVAVLDHHLYLPSLAFVPLLAAGLSPSRLRGAAAALLLLAAAALLQSRHWRDSEALWARVLAVRPLSPAARLNLAAARGDEGRLPEALVAVDEQLALYPRDPLALRLREEILARAAAGPGRLESDAAAWLFENGRVREATARMEAALALAPRDPDLLVNAAIIDATAGRRERARERLTLALRLSPGRANAAAALARLDELERR
ncbi:MAG: tetratricopeptide repeat protein [Elusimicrobiota bacterium]|nr:tetratricopeptide repeat protein [Elusimicrobiota bacterium]